MSTQGLVRPRPAPVWGDTALVNSQRSPLYPPVSERSQGCEDTEGLGERSETIIMWGLSGWGSAHVAGPGRLPLRNSPLPMVTWLARVWWK